MSERREFVENRESWESEYGNFVGRLGVIGDHVTLMARYVPALETEALRVLDIGCAYGHYLNFWRKLNPGLDVYGVEVARRAAEQAELYAGEGRVFWQSCGARVPVEDASCDLVYSFDMVEHVADMTELERMADEIARVLKPGGAAFVETPNYNRRMQALYRMTGQGHWLKYDHCNLFDEKKLRSFLEPRLRVETVLYRGNFNPGGRVPVVKGIHSRRLYLSSHLMAVCRLPAEVQASR